MTVIEQIYEFNKQAGLLEKGYDDARECAFPIEEALENFDTQALSQRLVFEADLSAKDLSRKIIDLTEAGEWIQDVNRLDKHLDILVFTFGSIFKLGLSVEQTLQALKIVMDANMQKLQNKKVDANGKLMKDKTTFIEPEPLLQEILNNLEKK